MKPGTHVFDIADERFVGIVERVTHGRGGHAKVRWDNGMISYVPVAKLRITEPDGCSVPKFPTAKGVAR